MHITLIMVSTVNGKITSGDIRKQSDWISPEDAALFTTRKKQHTLLVMGRKTWQRNIKHITLEPKVLRIILTNHPSEYASDAVKGQLEFVSMSPKKLVASLEGLGYKKMLLVGGSEINSLFFKENLVDELHLTIEPHLFGKGNNLLSEINVDVPLKLKSIEKLNQSGTLHAIYTILKP